MSHWRYVVASLRHFKRIHLATATGVATAAAVIAGALIVGDSVRGSLRDLAVKGLERVDVLLRARAPFREALAEHWPADPQVAAKYERAVPLLILRGAAVRQTDAAPLRAAGLDVWAIRHDFWGLEAHGARDHADASRLTLADDEAAVSSQTAEELGVVVGDRILVTLPTATNVPADSPLGEKEENSASRRFRVAAVLSAERGDPMALFSLLPNQRAPRNLFLPLQTVQTLLDLPGQVNALALARRRGKIETTLSDAEIGALEAATRPTLADFGVQLRPTDLPFPTDGGSPADEASTDGEGPTDEAATDGEGPTDEAATDEGSPADETATDEGSPADETATDGGSPADGRDVGMTVNVGMLEERRSRRRIVQIDSHRLILPPPLVDAAEAAFAGIPMQPSVVALANRITHDDKTIPYSLIAGIDSMRAFGPLFDAHGAPIVLTDEEAALNDWAARELGVAVGDPITIFYYEPETTHGRLVEAPPIELKVSAIVPLVDARGNPMPAFDPHLAPELPGVTDQQTINDWELPFELVEPIRDQDEDYWDIYRTTPKAFVSLALGKRLWQTRWGAVTALRLPMTAVTDRDHKPSVAIYAAAESAAASETAWNNSNAEVSGIAQMARALEQRLDASRLGMQVVPIRRQAIAAASGTTPFEGLFLGFSFFLLASALTLAALLFRLGVEQRASEVGLLLSAGLTPRRVERLLLAEGAIAALAGAAAGSVAGAAYARVMIHGLNTWWVAATSTPFLKLAVKTSSVVTGAGLGWLAALGAIYFALRKLVRLPARSLLAGETQPQLTARASLSRRSRWLALLCWGCAVALALAAWFRQGEAQALAFLASGALVLTAALLQVHVWMHPACAASTVRFSLLGLAARNARRNPGRTLMTLGLAASASFLLVGLGAFRLAPSEQGCGGFDLLATSDVSLHQDLHRHAGRTALGFSREESESLDDATIVSFRLHDGADASCLNLYQVAQPRVLGTPTSLADASQFTWSNHAELESGASPWTLLDRDLGVDEQGRRLIPVVLDRNTAQYSLKLFHVGDRYAIRDGEDRPVALQVVGMLEGSVLQGDLMIGEQSFLSLFPESAGQRFFLIRVPGDATHRSAIQARLEEQLEDYGFDVRDARSRLADLMAVQNTYLSTFQSLGLLGLLLGAVGLAVAQLRSALERRSELALLRAVGFDKTRLSFLLLAENATLLAGGLAIGSLAAGAAVLPHALVNHISAPWGTLVLLLGTTLATGGFAGILAARAALDAPLLPALRGE